MNERYKVRFLWLKSRKQRLRGITTSWRPKFSPAKFRRRLGDDFIDFVDWTD